MIVYYIIMGIIAYLIGSVNFSILISKKTAGFDIREKVVEMLEQPTC